MKGFRRCWLMLLLHARVLMMLVDFENICMGFEDFGSFGCYIKVLKILDDFYAICKRFKGFWQILPLHARVLKIVVDFC